MITTNQVQADVEQRNKQADCEADEAWWLGMQDRKAGLPFRLGCPEYPAHEDMYAEGYVMAGDEFEAPVYHIGDPLVISEVDESPNTPLLDALIEMQRTKLEAQWARCCAASIPQGVLAAKIYAAYRAEANFQYEDRHSFGDI